MLTRISLLVALVINGKQNATKNPLVLSDGYVKYEEAEVHRSVIMQDFRDMRKKNLKWSTGDIYHELSLCETFHFVL